MSSEHVARSVRWRWCGGRNREALVLLSSCALYTSELSGQTGTRRPTSATTHRWIASGEVSAALGGTWLTSTTAPTVRTDIGVGLSVGAHRALSARTRGGFALRVQSQPLRLSEAGTSWDGGTLTVGDLVGTLAVPALRAGGIQSEVEISSGLSLLAGARGIYPFSSAGTITPVIGLGANVFRAAPGSGHTHNRRLSMIVRYDLIRLDPGPTLAASQDTFSGTAGWASRISAGLRVHR